MGEYKDMDEIYNNDERNKSRAYIKCIIEHINKAYEILYQVQGELKI
jgi:hypothetical protein